MQGDTREQKTLRISIMVTMAMALLGVVFGLVSGSNAIVFDGVYSTVDAAMSVLALFVSRLLMKRGSARFQFGYSHFEPLVAAFNGSVLLLLCFYAFIDAISSFLNGGQLVAFDAAASYSGIVCVVCFVCYMYERGIARELDSEFLRIDMQSWLMAGSITLALLVGFAAAELLSRLGYPHYAPYADPLILMLLALGLLPIPVEIVKRALIDIFQVAPSELDQKVQFVMQATLKKYGFLDYESYVLKSGRTQMVDIHILVAPDYVASVAEVDRIRKEIADQLAPEVRLDQWLSIDLTTRREWI
jgi:cation diffusion facilitator family transporter